MTATTLLTARALLLDMDGTLVNSDAVVERIWRRWADRHGFDGGEVMKVVHGRQGYASMAVLLPSRPTEQNYADNARMLAEETADMDGVVAIPGATEFLASRHGLPHALVTSADVALSTAHGSRGAGTARGAGHRRVRRREQAGPAGFLKGAAELGVAPEDCVVFEDSAAGIAAGRSAGMRVVGVGPRAGFHRPDVVVLDLQQVRGEALGGGAVRLYVG
jgi:mannitol-1-/sugar-/sorbitol-6-phosphatase